MNRQEAIEYIQEWLKDEYALNGKDRIVLNMAIKALEQEPSEDCIDRYSALAELDPLSYDYKAIQELPSVVPKGKWIDKNGWSYCSNCERKAIPQSNGCEIEPCRTPFCQWCGADMRGEEG